MRSRWQLNHSRPDLTPLVIKLAGGKWTADSLPSPNVLGVGVLNAVSCPTRGSCVAEGDSNLNNAPDGVFAETLSGGSWSEADIPEPSGYVIPPFGPTGLSCTMSGSCVGLFSAGDGLSFSRTVVETLSGSTWTPTLLDPITGLANAQMAGLSCPVATSCFAVGDYVDVSGTEYPLVESRTTGQLIRQGCRSPVVQHRLNFRRCHVPM